MLHAKIANYGENLPDIEEEVMRNDSEIKTLLILGKVALCSIL